MTSFTLFCLFSLYLSLFLAHVIRCTLLLSYLCLSVCLSHWWSSHKQFSISKYDRVIFLAFWAKFCHPELRGLRGMRECMVCADDARCHYSSWVSCWNLVIEKGMLPKLIQCSRKKLYLQMSGRPLLMESREKSGNSKRITEIVRKKSGKCQGRCMSGKTSEWFFIKKTVFKHIFDGMSVLKPWYWRWCLSLIVDWKSRGVTCRCIVVTLRWAH